MRTLPIATAFLALASAFLLYGLNYDTRRMEARLAKQERKAETMRSDIAVLKAERAHLARPERIEAIARTLGLRPPGPKQLAETAAPGNAPAARGSLPR